MKGSFALVHTHNEEVAIRMCCCSIKGWGRERHRPLEKQLILHCTTKVIYCTANQGRGETTVGVKAWRPACEIEHLWIYFGLFLCMCPLVDRLK